MYSSFSGMGGRSKSTTDVFKASNLDDSSYPPVTYTTLSRNNRRRTASDAKKQNFPVEDESGSLKRARSYLTEDIRRQFELGFESSTKKTPTRQAPSPTSNNFVKKLVATLERRQRESNANKVVCSADAEFCRPSITEYEKNCRRGVTGSTENLTERQYDFVETFNPDDVFSRVTSSPLEDVQERESEDEDDFSSDPEDYTPKIWTGETSSKVSSRNINNQNDGNNNPSKFSARRTFKNVISSLMNWRSGGKSLPKGSRDYYATRESLGEEMRAFRRDTMPRLMEHAGIKSRRERTDERQREFNDLIGSPKLIDETQQPSIATIHPVYGCKTVGMQHRFSRGSDSDDKPEVVHVKRKIQPPTTPIRRCSSSPPKSEHLLRPSEVKDLQKRISQDMTDSSTLTEVQLRRHPTMTSSSQTIYDVPRSNRRVLAADSHNLFTPPEYENVSGLINDDKRLQCTAFTTF